MTGTWVPKTGTSSSLQNASETPSCFSDCQSGPRPNQGGTKRLIRRVLSHFGKGTVSTDCEVLCQLEAS